MKLSCRKSPIIAQKSHRRSFESLENRQLLAVAAAVQEAARDEILDGVDQWTFPNELLFQTGTVAVFDPSSAGEGEGAFAVTHSKRFDTEIAAAMSGDGRIVAFPGAAHLSFGQHTKFDTGQLYKNSIEWVSDAANDAAAKSLKIVTNVASASTWLTAQNFTNVTLTANWATELGTADVVIVPLQFNATGLSDDQRTSLTSFVEGGGGLITGGFGEFLDGLNSTNSANKFLREFGLGWARGISRFFLDGAHPSQTTIYESNSLSNASEAVRRLPDLVSSGTAEERLEASKAIRQMRDVLPETHTLVKSALDVFKTVADTTVITASPDNPLSDPLLQQIWIWDIQRKANNSVDQIIAHPSAEVLYGDIPDNALRLERTVSVDTSQSHRLSTGLYVPPGEVVEVTVPANLVNANYKIRISGHDAAVAGKPIWNRYPLTVAREFPISSQTTRIASSFGGALYLDFGPVPLGLGAVSIDVAGAIQAPYFVLGQTSDQDWNAWIRNNPGPYAELVSEHVAMSIPSEWIRDLDNPTDLMTYWNRAQEYMDWIAGFDGTRTKAERFNIDVDTGAGTLTAGYPIQGSVVHGPSRNIVDLALLQKEGSWGYFHELGHGMQNGPNGSWGINYYDLGPQNIESNVNLFTNAAIEELALNIRPRENADGWDFAQRPIEVMQQAQIAIADPAPFSEKRVGGVTSVHAMYFQLADMFGWETYREVFQEYNKGFVGDANKVQDRRDQWFEIWSRVTQHDMTEYMIDHWKLTVSDAAKSRVSSQNLPSWMPLAFGSETAHIAPGETFVLNTDAAGMSLDGFALATTLNHTQLGAAEWIGNEIIYTPPEGFTGVDSFEVEYESSAGNQMTFTQHINVGLPLAWGMNEGDGKVIVNDAIGGVDVRRQEFGPTRLWTSDPFFGTRGTFLADVNGDQKDDAITVNDDKVRIRLSAGNGFQSATDGTGVAYYGSQGTFFEDVTGDGMADAIVVNDDKITVRRSNGVAFNANESWTNDSFVGDRETIFADVDGNGTADVIAVDNNRIRVRRSTGSEFGPVETWSNVGYFGTRGTYFADVTGDGMADGIVVNDDKITVRRSIGTSFSGNESWTDRAFFGSKGTYVSDFDGDKMADVVVVNDNGVTVLPSTGSQFAHADQRIDFAFFGNKENLFGDIDGNGRSDMVVVNSNAIAAKLSPNRFLQDGTGTLEGNPRWVPGYSGTALEFDGDGDRVTIENASLFGETDFTISAWIKSTKGGMILQQRTGQGQLDGQFFFRMTPEGKLNFHLSSVDNEVQFDLTTDETVNDGEWHHVVAQRDGLLGRIFIDGSLGSVGFGNIAFLNDDLTIALGYDLRDNNQHYEGLLDEVRIYDFAIDIDLIEDSVIPNSVEERLYGDSNGDGKFDSSDLIRVFAAGEYQDGIPGNSTFEEGDWNGDGDFDTTDLIQAFAIGHYGKPAPAVARVVDQLFQDDDQEDEKIAKRTERKTRVETQSDMQWQLDRPARF